MTGVSPTKLMGAAADAAPRGPIGPVIVGTVLATAGVFLVHTALAAVDSDGVSLDGPRLAPIVVSGGWLALAVVYLAMSVVSCRRREPRQADTDDADSDESDVDNSRPARWATPSTLIAALVTFALVLETIGFVLASAAFFVVAARILGSRKIARDVTVALSLVLVAYLGFTRLLDIHLPAGVLPL